MYILIILGIILGAFIIFSIILNYIYSSRPLGIKKMKEIKDLKGLIKLLGYRKDREVRNSIIDAIAEIGDAAIDPLILALYNKNKNIRLDAVETLGKIGNSRAVEPLIASLKDTSSNVRYEAVRVLEGFGSRAVELLTIALKDSDPAVQKGARETLQMLMDNENEDLRSSAAEALNKIGDPFTMKPQNATLNEEDKHEPSTVEKDQEGIRTTPLFDNLLTGSLDKDIWEEAEELVAIGAPVVEPIIAFLSDNSNAFQGTPITKKYWSEVTLVARSDTQEVIPYANDLQEKFFNSLQEMNLNVREAAAMWVLGEIGDPRAIKPLIDTLKNKDKLTRWTAAGALFTIGDTHSLEALLADLNDEDLLVWGGHHGVWRLVGDGRTVKRLIAGLVDENEDMRKRSAKSLKKLGWKRCS